MKKLIILFYCCIGGIYAQDTKPLDILLRGNEECKKLSSIEYLIHIETNNSSSFPQVILEAEITQLRREVEHNNFLPGLFRIKGISASTGKNRFNYSYNGTEYFFSGTDTTLLYKGKERPGGEISGVSGPILYAGIPNLLRKEPFGGIINNLDSIKLKEDIIIMGENCYNLEIYMKDVSQITDGDQIVINWFFSKKDFLPRGNSGNSSIPLNTYIKLKRINFKIEPEYFTLTQKPAKNVPNQSVEMK